MKVQALERAEVKHIRWLKKIRLHKLLDSVIFLIVPLLFCTLLAYWSGDISNRLMHNHTWSMKVTEL